MIDDAFGHWLAGLFDGEGCFTITARGKARRSFAPSFTLCLREDDAEIVEEIARRTGFGRVYHVIHRRPGVRDRYRVEWKVYRKRDVLALAALLDRYPLRSKKARDFRLWREAVRLWGERVGHRGAVGRSSHPVMGKLVELKTRMEDGRRFCVK